MKNDLKRRGADVGADAITTPVEGYTNYLQTQYDVPKMWVDEDVGRVHLQHGEHHRILTADHEPDPEVLDAALENIENYVETIDRWGETNNPRAVKVHMYEGILYGLWAPFVNLYARQFYGNVTLDNALQYLYIFGESDAGKDKFSEFVLRLVSDDLVRAAPTPTTSARTRSARCGISTPCSRTSSPTSPNRRSSASTRFGTSGRTRGTRQMRSHTRRSSSRATTLGPTTGSATERRCSTSTSIPVEPRGRRVLQGTGRLERDSRRSQPNFLVRLEASSERRDVPRCWRNGRRRPAGVPRLLRTGWPGSTEILSRKSRRTVGSTSGSASGDRPASEVTWNSNGGKTTSSPTSILNRTSCTAIGRPYRRRCALRRADATSSSRIPTTSRNGSIWMI